MPKARKSRRSTIEAKLAKAEVARKVAEQKKQDEKVGPEVAASTAPSAAKPKRKVDKRREFMEKLRGEEKPQSEPVQSQWFSMVDAPSISAKSTVPEKKLKGKQKRAAEAADVKKLELVFSDPAFQADPLAALEAQFKQ